MWNDKYDSNIHSQSIIATDDNIQNYFNKIIKENKLNNNILIVGDTGTCKTTCINYLINNLTINKKMIITLSHNNIKQIINSSLIKFCDNCELDDNLNLVIIDNLDKFQDRIHDILFNIMKQYQNNIKFIFTCTDLQNISNSIQTNSEIIKFNKISNSKIEQILKYIIKNEQIKLNNLQSIINQIIIIANGDLRKSVILLQIIHNVNNPDILDITYLLGCQNHSINEQIINYLINKNYTNLIILLKQIYKDYLGLNILYGLRLYLLCNDIEETHKMDILNKISILEYKIFENGDYLINIINGLIN